MYALKASTGEFIWNVTIDGFSHVISEIRQITSNVILIMNGDATYVNTTNGEIIRKGERGFFYKNRLPLQDKISSH
jgi:outer membrane protein assembly factor BamB